MKASNEVNLSKYILFTTLIGLIVVLSISTNNFFTVGNIISVLRQISVQAITAIGMTMVIISGNIDLSCGAITAFISVLFATLVVSGVPLMLSIIIAIIVAGGLGFINGTIIAKYKVNSMIVTLATTTIIRGFGYIMTGGYPVSFRSKAFSVIGQGYLSIIPVPVIIMIVFFILGNFILKNTAFGRSIYAVGGNEEAARSSGINTYKIKVLVFSVGGLMTGVAGIILTSRLMCGVPNVGIGTEMDIIAAVIIGGTRFSGGIGSLSGTIIGMLLIGVITNGMVILGMSGYLQMVARGMVILLAVVLNSYNERR